MLLPRIITAVIGVPFVVACAHLGGALYICFVGMVIAMSLYEYGMILKLGKRPVQAVPLVLLGLTAASAAVIERIPSSDVDNIMPAALTFIILSVSLWEVFTSRRSIEKMAYTLFGIFFIAWNLSYLINIRDIRPHGEYLTLMLFATVWVSDTAAYFIGKKFGQKKLLEEVSPKKTWEGALAGFVFSVGVYCGLRNFFIPDGMSALSAILMGVVIGILGQISDLAESIIKRSVGVKDSSGMLPGHGGILDRFDSYILLAPIYYYCALILK